MNSFRKMTLALIVGCVLLGSVAGAWGQGRDLKASVPIIPPLVESKDKGILIDLLKAMAAEYKDGTITWDVYPFARSLENVQAGRADFHMPFLFNPLVPLDQLPFQYSTDTIFSVIFSLYTNRSNTQINPGNVDRYKIETDAAHTAYFSFKTIGSTSIEASLQKVSLGRVDGWIMAMPESDLALQKLGLKNIKRWEYKRFDTKIILPKGERGKEVDLILSGLIKALKAKGTYQKIMGPILDQKFEELKM